MAILEPEKGSEAAGIMFPMSIDLVLTTSSILSSSFLISFTPSSTSTKGKASPTITGRRIGSGLMAMSDAECFGCWSGSCETMENVTGEGNSGGSVTDAAEEAIAGGGH